MSPDVSLSTLDDRDLLAHAAQLAAAERTATAALIACLAEVDARRLYLGEGYSSLFTYCTRALRLSEHAAYGRIEAARLARRFPIVLELLEHGAVTLTTVTLLGPLLTDENHRELLDAARHRSRREVEQIVAAHRPRPDVPSTIRKLPAPVSKTNDEGRTTNGVAAAAGPASPDAGAPQVDAFSDLALATHVTAASFAGAIAPLASPLAPRPAVVAPLTPERYKVQCTVSRETHDKLRRAQDLLRHAIPNGDVAAIFDRALTLLVDHLERAKLARTAHPRTPKAVSSGSRAIPATVRRAVCDRDAGRCAFVGADGRCAETGFLEFHHVVPYARGGAATVDNIQLRCRAHNQHEAVEQFGQMFVRECGAEYCASGRVSVARAEAGAAPFVVRRSSFIIDDARRGTDAVPTPTGPDRVHPVVPYAMAARPPSTTSSFGAARTTSTRRWSSSASCTRGNAASRRRASRSRSGSRPARTDRPLRARLRRSGYRCCAEER